VSELFRNKRELTRHVGDYSQLFGVRDVTLNGGRAQGVRALEVNNGSGLAMTVLPDRAMDIAWLSWRGTNLSYITRAGIVAPAYFQENGLNFLRSFTAGFLTTCGLRNVGSPCEDNGESFGLHGNIAHVPAEEVSAVVDWTEESPEIILRGKLRDARLFGQHLMLERRITCPVGSAGFQISDRIENRGFSPEPLMLLYHFNLGYPLLDADAELLLPVQATRARDAQAEPGLADCCRFQPPTPGYSEQVFHHDLRSDDRGQTCAALINSRLGLGVSYRYNNAVLPNLTEWKMMGEGDYVLGIEPCNNFGRGRAAARQAGELDILQPGEVRQYTIDIAFHEGEAELQQLRQTIEQLGG